MLTPSEQLDALRAEWRQRVADQTGQAPDPEPVSIEVFGKAINTLIEAGLA